MFSVYNNAQSNNKIGKGISLKCTKFPMAFFAL